MNQQYNHFFDWFHENEGFALRSERFYSDLWAHVACSAAPLDIVNWLAAAFEAGRMEKD
jgi:hypothetical protein